MRKCLLLPLLAWLLLAFAPAAPAAFSDVPASHWARPFIDAMVRRGFVSGYPDGTFKPNQAVTRAEFAAMISGALNLAALSTVPGRAGTPPFTDSAGHWARDAIAQAWRTGFLSGYPDGSFRPDSGILRMEAYNALAGGLGLPAAPDTLLSRFTDQASVPAWARAGLARALQARLPGTGSGTVAELRPAVAITRAEAMVAIFQSRSHDGREIKLRSRQLQGSCSSDAVCASGQLCTPVSASGSHGFCAVPTRTPCSGCTLPVLMYHDVVERNAAGDEVSRAQLAAHLDWLEANHYRTLSLEQALRYMLTGVNPMPGFKPVLLTFDDGYIGNFTIAFPLLRDRGMRAVYFVHTAFVGVLTGKDHLDWNEIATVEASGLITVHSHTRNHPVNPDLNALNFAQVELELRGALDDHLARGRSLPLELAYPRGSHDDEVRQIAGWFHRSAFRVASAPALLGADPLAIPRIGINSQTTTSVLQSLLSRPAIL